MKNFDLLVAGDILLDTIISVKNICKGGVHYRPIVSNAGGLSGIAVWASRNGTITAIFGSLGRDSEGKKIINIIQKEKVHSLIYSSTLKTGRCICLVDKDKDRTIIVDRGCCDDTRGIKSIMNQVSGRNYPKYLFLSSYSFYGKGKMNYLKLIKKAKSKIIFNAAASTMLKKNRKFIIKIISKYVHCLILNEDEALVLTNSKDVKIAYSKLKKIINIFCITRGSKYSISCDGENKFEALPIKVKSIKDTVGAGDAFIGGFIAGVVKKYNFEDSINLGHHLAAKSLSKIGAI